MPIPEAQQVVKQLLRLLPRTTPEPLGEVPKISSKDQILHRTREQFLDVPMPRMIEQFVDEGRVSRQNPAADLSSSSRAFQICRLWRSLSSRFSHRTGFNSVLLSRTSNIPWMSLRQSQHVEESFEVVKIVLLERISEKGL